MTNVSFLTPKDILDISEDSRILLEDAYSFAQHAHEGQSRKNGEPYFVHPLGVAQELWMRYQDVELTTAALLHDVLEDCEVARKEIYTRFGQRVGFLVDAVTKNYENFLFHQDLALDKVEKVLWGGIHDVRVFLLKLADREDNLSSLAALKNGKQIRIAFETHAIYEPLSDLLAYSNSGLSLEQVKDRFWQQIPKDCKTDPVAFKEFLMDQSLEHFDSNLFESIYTDSGSPLWSITDWDTYERITSDESLSQNIEFISIKGNKDSFIANFQFTGGALIKGAKFDISGYRGK